MIFVSHLTEWKSVVATRGRTVGSETRSRTVLAVDNWNWIIGTQRHSENDNIVGERFFGNLKILFPVISKEFGNLKEIAKAIVDKDFEENDPYLLGKLIDEQYGSSFMKEYPPTVIKKLFSNKKELVEV